MWYLLNFKSHSFLSFNKTEELMEHLKQIDESQFDDYEIINGFIDDCRLDIETFNEMFKAKDNYEVIWNSDDETILSIQGKNTRADWYRASEGLCGDYNPDNPDDVELLRFDIYYREDVNKPWNCVEDASYCTFVAVSEEPKVLEKYLSTIWRAYDDVLRTNPYASVKKLGEELSWIGTGMVS